MLLALKNRFKRQQHRWLDSRIPKAEQYQLDKSSIFILPTFFGMLFVFVAILIFVIGTNYQHMALKVLSFFLISLFVLHLFASYINFARLHVSIGQIKPVFAGTNAAVPLTLLGNRQKRSPKGTMWVSFMGNKWYQAIELDSGEPRYNIRYFAHKRGVRTLPRITIQCDYPLGLFRCWTHLQFIQTITVYPSPLPCTVQLESIAKLDESIEGDALHGEENQQHDEFKELRSFQKGDPLHSIAWKQLARSGEMMSKTFSGVSPQRGYLSLPMHGNIEKGLKQLAFQINQCHHQRQPYGLFLPHKVVSPNNTEAHRIECLQALAEFPIVGNSEKNTDV